jgi:hypothetical protein
MVPELIFKKDASKLVSKNVRICGISLGIRTWIIQLKIARTRPESDPTLVFCINILKENCITFFSIIVLR